MMKRQLLFAPVLLLAVAFDLVVRPRVLLSAVMIGGFFLSTHASCRERPGKIRLVGTLSPALLARELVPDDGRDCRLELTPVASRPGRRRFRIRLRLTEDERISCDLPLSSRNGTISFSAMHVQVWIPFEL